MPLSNVLPQVLVRTQGLSPTIRYALTLLLVLLLFGVRHVAERWLPLAPYPFLLGFVGILLSAALFDRGSGYLATAATAVLTALLYLPPIGSLRVSDPGDLGALLVSVLLGTAITAIIETLHTTIARLGRTLGELHAAFDVVKEATDDLLRSERARTLLLAEFRHRTRNDLNSLVALLHLRARAAASEAAREGLVEAAGHALALSRVHARLAAGEGTAEDDPAAVHTGPFVTGLCRDLEAAHLGGALRPVAVLVEAEDHLLSADRAVPLGLVLNEAMTNALKYAFPEDRAGQVRVRFRRERDEFVLTVSDDGIGLPLEGEAGVPPSPPPAGSGLGTRLLRGLAAQLRGTFSREPGEDGSGAVVTLRMPATLVRS